MLQNKELLNVFSYEIYSSLFLMYKLPHFTEQDSKLVLEFIHQHPFATLIGNHDSISVATQIPLLISAENDILSARGHIMRGTDHYKAFTQNPQALVLFQGPQCYVSASWYQERGHGSTWNYMTVHARGIVNFLDDAGTIQILTELTNKYEQDKENPETLDKMTPDYISSNVKAIAGFEIVFTEVHPIFKLSQNRDDVSYRNIIQQLQKSGKYEDAAVAQEMIKRRPHLYS
jgi:transcriptional regulator